VTDAHPDAPSLFDRLGGADGVRALVDRFYDEMDAAPDARAIRELHPEDLASSREKLHLFLCGWLGGPPLYVEKYGHPRLRARHLPFPIGERERDQWLTCMLHALAGTPLPEAERDQLMLSFVRLADHMRNQPG
jgi:hemoglobin